MSFNAFGLRLTHIATLAAFLSCFGDHDSPPAASDDARLPGILRSNLPAAVDTVWALVLKVAVPPSSSHGTIMAAERGYLVDAVTGNVIATFTAAELKQRWQPVPRN